MQININVRSFFFHVASEFAIGQGWDFVQDLTDFYKDNPNLAAKLNESIYVQIQDSVSLSEWDVLQASNSVATEGFQQFWLEFAKGLYSTAPDNAVILQSMHSGSSDYLYVKDIRELVSGKIDLQNV